MYDLTVLSVIFAIRVYVLRLSRGIHLHCVTVATVLLFDCVCP